MRYKLHPRGGDWDGGQDGSVLSTVTMLHKRYVGFLLVSLMVMQPIGAQCAPWKFPECSHRLLPQAPPTLLIWQQTRVMSRLTCIAARLCKCGTCVHSFILHFRRVLCVVKPGGDFRNEEIEDYLKRSVICRRRSAEPSLHLLSTLEM